MIASSSPFAPLNLLRNPFGEPAQEDLPGLVVADVDAFVDWLVAPRHALQLIGEGGRGKTARLQALRDRFPQSPYVYLAEGERVPPLPRTERLLLDEAQRLPRFKRRRLFKHSQSLALATHEDLESELESAGWRVLTVRIEGMHSDLLRSIVGRRVEWSRRGPGPVLLPSEDRLERLRARYDDDLRSLFDELYEDYQARTRDPEAAPDAWRWVDGEV